MYMEYCYESSLNKKTSEKTPNNGPLSLLQENRPREKLIRSGPHSLSNEELLSIILVSGIKGKNVTILSRDLLAKLETEKNIPPVKELCLLSGLGLSKSCAIVAMLEFGRRKWAIGQRIRNPSDIYNLVRHHADKRQEKFLCLSLNGAYEVLALRLVTIGLVNKTIVHPREVLADPILDRASAIAVAHNHPSGNLTPSMEDKEITVRLKGSANLLGLNLIDHLVFSENSFFSFNQEGLL